MEIAMVFSKENCEKIRSRVFYNWEIFKKIFANLETYAELIAAIRDWAIK
jgi:hypothetical protein